MKHCVYWIHIKDHTDIFTQGYIGVTNNLQRRSFRHFNYTDNQHLKNAINKYGKDNLVIEEILIAEEQYCLDIEKKLRSKEQTGWNISVGGGKPPTSKPRGENYVSPLKGISKATPWLIGRKKSETEKKLISERRKVKVKFENKIYDSLEDLAKCLNIKYSTLTNRIYRNPQKYGYEVQQWPHQ